MKVNSEVLYELINDGTIKENTKFEVYRDDVYITIIEFDGYDFNWDSGCFTSGMFYDPLVEFKEIIEEEKDIEEFKTKYTCSELDFEMIDKINELVRAYNSLKDK